MTARTRWHSRSVAGCLALSVLLALPWPRDAHAAGGLEFSKDTVWERWYDSVSRTDKVDSVYLVNTLAESLVVDTLMVLLDTFQMKVCQVVFVALKNQPPTGPYESSWQVYGVGFPPAVYPLTASWGYSPIRVAPGHRVLLFDFMFDECISCPLSFGAGKSLKWNVGDSIWVSVVFIAGQARDTLVVKGVKTAEFSSRVSHLSDQRCESRGHGGVASAGQGFRLDGRRAPRQPDMEDNLVSGTAFVVRPAVPGVRQGGLELNRSGGR